MDDIVHEHNGLPAAVFCHCRLCADVPIPCRVEIDMVPTSVAHCPVWLVGGGGVSAVDVSLDCFDLCCSVFVRMSLAPAFFRAAT